jgi:ferredoxin
LVRIGSELGAELLRSLETQPATAFQTRAAENAIEQAVQGMGRQLDTEGLPQLLQDRLMDPVWEKVADRCLNCTNCTLVCPTCFCWDVKDESNLSGDVTERVRYWDSCFNPDHSYHAGGGSNRPTVCSRYRQWLTHKLGTWVEQFDVFGCVGCGRCITWCPAGIDITEEVAAIRQEVQA